jgi:NAD(P)-dependent dehydrogenase (short-subunit alcohol dehydrogenase family)
MGRLDGQVAIVTGGGTGIGKGIAKALAQEGASVVLASRDRATLEASASDIRALGAAAEVVPTDVTDEGQVEALFQATLARFGRLDVLINNSGVFDGGPIEDLTLETWRKVVDVNLTGPFLCAREAMRIMKRQRSGRIVNIGSISAQVPRMDSAPYTATKHGLVGLTKSLALEGRAHRITASCLHPGNVLTERRAAGSASMDAEPMMTTADFASIVVAAVALPAEISLLEAIILPTEQPYVGRG